MTGIMSKIQQKGLKRVLKAWLSKCHPQKQARFPYNGGKDQELKRKNGDSDYDNLNPGLLTAPDYWPSQTDWLAEHGHEPTGVRHKEPDHLLKPGKDPVENPAPTDAADKSTRATQSWYALATCRRSLQRCQV